MCFIVLIFFCYTLWFLFGFSDFCPYHFRVYSLNKSYFPVDSYLVDIRLYFFIQYFLSFGLVIVSSYCRWPLLFYCFVLIKFFLLSSSYIVGLLSCKARLLFTFSWAYLRLFFSFLMSFLVSQIVPSLIFIVWFFYFTCISSLVFYVYTNRLFYLVFGYLLLYSSFYRPLLFYAGSLALALSRVFPPFLFPFFIYFFLFSFLWCFQLGFISYQLFSLFSVLFFFAYTYIFSQSPVNSRVGPRSCYKSWAGSCFGCASY